MTTKSNAENNCYRWLCEWKGHRINGEWVNHCANSEEKTTLNPNNAEEILTYSINRELIKNAIESSYSKINEFKKINIDERMNYISRIEKLLIDKKKMVISAMLCETGKPYWDAMNDYQLVINYMNWLLNNKTKIKERSLSQTFFDERSGSYNFYPVGVTVAHVNSSSPLLSFISAITSTIISACPTIFFSEEQSAINTMVFAEIESLSEITRGFFNFIFADFEHFKSSLLDKKIAAVIYSGSFESCEELYKSSEKTHSRRFLLQNSGKNAALVHSTADLETAIRSIVYGAFRSAGQLLQSTSRVFVYRSLLDEFLNRIEKAATQMEIGSTDNWQNKPGPLMGPLQSKHNLESFLRFQTMANREATKTIIWGRAHESIGKGFFVQPGVNFFEKFDAKSAYQSSVTFSPDLAIYSYDILDEVIAQLNSNGYGHTMSFFGERHILEKRNHLFQSMNVLINLPTVAVDSFLSTHTKTHHGSTLYTGVAMAYELSTPQVLVDSQDYSKLIQEWPWSAETE